MNTFQGTNNQIRCIRRYCDDIILGPIQVHRAKCVNSFRSSFHLDFSHIVAEANCKLQLIYEPEQRQQISTSFSSRCPHQNSKAKKFDDLSYDDVISKNLKVMDITAITLAKENKIPIIVFSILQKDSLIEIIEGVGSFTTIKG